MPARLFAAALLFLVSCAAPVQTKSTQRSEAPTSLRPARFVTAGKIAAVLSHMNPPRPVPGAWAVIVPHHWLAADLILGGLRDLFAARRVARIVLLGPNHTGAGGDLVATTRLSWDTDAGLVQGDAAAVGSLLADGLATERPDVLAYEHSVAGVVPAIAVLAPRARVVPLVIRGVLSMTEVRRLAATLARLIDTQTLLVASVDFSHYLSAAEARANDEETVRTLRAFDTSRVLAYGNEHVDAPPVIALLLETARRLGASRFVLRNRSDSSFYTGVSRPPVTSYLQAFLV
jgi:MEMO1 family protein